VQAVTMPMELLVYLVLLDAKLATLLVAAHVNLDLLKMERLVSNQQIVEENQVFQEEETRLTVLQGAKLVISIITKI
jgi:hypothetical protein